jgi:hypothetical protein
VKRWALLALVVALAGACSDDATGRVETVVSTRGGGPADAKSVKAPNAGFASPTDGADSLKLPLVIEPAIGLKDRQTVMLTGRGFTPGAQIAVAQCWTPDGSPGSADGCDLGTTATGPLVRADGTFTMSVTVRQMISVGGKLIDCAAQQAESLCRLGAANVRNYDESGVAHLSLEPSDTANAPPLIDVSQTDGLRDGADLVVTGAGFVPGETVQLGVCVLGGMSGYELCWLRNQIRTVAADPDGTFATTITATRYVKTADGPGDCRTDPYGCRVLVRANRSPNAVKLQFADG